jgi:hypothetical protein
LVAQDLDRIAENMVKKLPMRHANLTYIPWPTMVTTSPNLECGLFEGHIFAILISPSAPFVQPTHQP